MPVERTEIEVMFLRTGDEPAETRRGWSGWKRRSAFAAGSSSGRSIQRRGSTACAF